MKNLTWGGKNSRIPLKTQGPFNKPCYNTHGEFYCVSDLSVSRQSKMVLLHHEGFIQELKIKSSHISLYIL